MVKGWSVEARRPIEGVIGPFGRCIIQLFLFLPKTGVGRGKAHEAELYKRVTAD